MRVLEAHHQPQRRRALVEAMARQTGQHSNGFQRAHLVHVERGITLASLIPKRPAGKHARQRADPDRGICCAVAHADTYPRGEQEDGMPQKFRSQ